MISAFQCGKCKLLFDDPDECMFHAIKEHPNLRKQENENRNDEDQLEYRPL
jgi:hypothetical protein